MKPTFKTIFSLETRKAFTRGNIIFFGVIGVILILLVTENIGKFRSVMENKKEFQEMEAQKIQQYVYYSQYANYGIKIFFMPCPFLTLLSDFKPDEITASINIGERLNISMPLDKGFPVENNGFLYFAGVILMCAAAFGLLSGYRVTKNPDYSRTLYRLNSGRSTFFHAAAANLILLNAAFLLLLGLCLLWLLIFGIDLFNAYLPVYILEFTLLSAFFFGIGSLVGFSDKRKSMVTLVVLIAASVFLIPWLSNKINQLINSDIESFSRLEKKNFELLMAAEKRAYNEVGHYKVNGQKAPDNVQKIVEHDQKTTFKQIGENLEKRKKQVLKRIKTNQTLLSLFPVTFAISLNNEISGCGGTNYIDFYTYCLDIKEKFKEYILKKKFEEGAVPGKVEPFTIPGKKDFNIYYAKSRLPFGFLWGIIVTLASIAVLLEISARKYKKRCLSMEKMVPVTEEMKANPLFILCQNNAVKNGIYYYFENRDRCAVLEKLDTDEFLFKGLTAGCLLTHLCRLAGVEEKKAHERLALMGIRDITPFALDHEILLKIAAAVETAKDFDAIILDDFVKNESRKFEADIFTLLSELESEGKRIIYLSCQMKQGSAPKDEIIKVDGYKAFPLDLASSSVR